MFKAHDKLNIPTFIHVSMSESNEIREGIKFPFSFVTDDPSLERIAVKKLQAVERGYYYPSIDIVFVRGEVRLTRTGHYEEDQTDCGFYESVQTISRESSYDVGVESCSELNGYMVFAYKTMEDMHTRKFTDSWKTWSGARMLSTKLPFPHLVTKLSFFRRLSGDLGFEYILIAKLKNMMANAAPALNVLHYMKPRICAYFGAYRKITFEVSKNLCKSLGLADADFVDALTLRMRVTYSNNTGYIELSENIEFRCKEEEEEAKLAKIKPGRISTQVQTDPRLSSFKQSRTLPRTISATPVPGTFITQPSPPEPANYSFVPTPDSLLNSILLNQTKIVTVGENYLLVIDNRDNPIIKKETTIIDDTTDDQNNITPKVKDINNENNQLTEDKLTEDKALGNVLQKEITIPADDGALLRRLKTEYFRSEEYTSAELCQRTPV